MDRVPIVVAVNGAVVIEDLDAPKIEPKAGFEEPREIDMPSVLEYEGDELEFMDGAKTAGKLILHTSAQPFPGRVTTLL